MRIIFLGSGAFAQPTLRWLKQSDNEVPFVVTQPARGSGRGRRMTPTPVRETAEELGLTVLEVKDVNHPDFVDQVRSVEPTLALVVAFGQKLGAELLQMLPAGWLNLHASLLPKYRGAAPINWALVNGEERTGCTVFRIVQRMDAGPVLASRWTSITPDETAGELHDRLAAMGVDAVDAALKLFAQGGKPDGTPQEEAEATQARKLTKRDGRVRFDLPVARIVDHIRGMTPWPGARARYAAEDGRWEDITVVAARRTELPPGTNDAPGVIDSRLYVAASDGYLEILELKPSSGRLMTWQDYVNGRHVRSGDSLVTPE